MELLTSAQIKQWDAFTCEHQKITSVELMERAAAGCLRWLEEHDQIKRPFFIFCGKGNNGGDGLALARLLLDKQGVVSVFVLDEVSRGSGDFESNLSRLKEKAVPILFIRAGDQLPVIDNKPLIIDALFGSGLNRPLEGLSSQLVEHINASGSEVIAIDIPSGMFADKSSGKNAVVKATYTLSFQVYKLAFLVAENEADTGKIHLIDIQLDPLFLENIQSSYEAIDPAIIRLLYKPRKAFSHKGSFGHALLIAGSYGKMGAAVLSARACLKSGVGLLTCHIPQCGYDIMQIANPEAMVYTDEDRNHLTGVSADLSKFNTIGIGPGLGTEDVTGKALASILSGFKNPVVIDADALNILSTNQVMLQSIPPFSILTPHPKEFERLFGPGDNDFEKISLALQKAKELQLIIVLKGHYTFIAMPGGKGFFNTTGNAGMATGGSGDVLTGFLTGLLAQKYTPAAAALLGVYLHGLAGDLAAADLSQEALLASDITDYIGAAYKKAEAY